MGKLGLILFVKVTGRGIKACYVVSLNIDTVLAIRRKRCVLVSECLCVRVMVFW